MQERRRSPRIPVRDEVFGRVKATLPVRLVDLSAHGAQLEASTGLPPAGEIDLWLPSPHGELRVKAAVRRCRANAGPRGLVFRAGVEFLDMDEIQRDHLVQILARLGGEPEAAVRAAVREVAGPGAIAADETLGFEQVTRRAG
jgi:c-di-GMP-binding flagellar brake protein YcgR